jgi:probable HAF family extracellular repeat protein
MIARLRSTWRRHPRGRMRGNTYTFKESVMKSSLTRASLALATALLAANAHAESPAYHLIDLGTFSDGMRVNAHREVAGEFGLEPAVRLPGGWSILMDAAGSAVGLDAAGNAVGNVRGADDLTVAYYWPASGGQVQIPLPHGTRYFTPVASAMAADGAVVGSVGDGFGRTACFLWAAGAPEARALPIGGGCQPHGIANRKLFVGTGAAVSGTPQQAFLWDGTDFHWLATLGGTFSDAFGVNKAGAVAGDAWTPTDSNGNFSVHAVMWADVSSPAVDLGTLPGKDWSQAAAINSSGVIVGYSSAVGREQPLAFVYSNGVMTDLNTLVDDARILTLTMAQDINDKGVIVGIGTSRKNGAGHTWMLVPIVH